MKTVSQPTQEVLEIAQKDKRIKELKSENALLKAAMAKQELLDLLKLLSAIESWVFSCNNKMPDYLLEKIDAAMLMVEREIMK